WLVIVTTDHGHLDEGGHGGGSWQERQSFVVAAMVGGCSPTRTADSWAESAENIDIAPTALSHLGVPPAERQGGEDLCTGRVRSRLFRSTQNSPLETQSSNATTQTASNCAPTSATPSETGSTGVSECGEQWDDTSPCRSGVIWDRRSGCEARQSARMAAAPGAGSGPAR